jgi:hypothetical protein
MKKLFYRLSSRRSFARLLSILAFAALGLLCFSGPAHAWGTGPSSSGFGFSGTLACTGGAFSGTLTPNTTDASETAIVKCTAVDPINGLGGTGTFQLTVIYAGIQSSCDNASSVRTYSAFCQDGTNVLGHLTWIGDTLSPKESLPEFCGGNNPCQLNVGSFPTKTTGTTVKVDSKACSDVFPTTFDSSGNQIFADKQVFLFQEIYHGPKCTGSVEPQNELARYCHSDSFNPDSQPMCIVGTGTNREIHKGDETTDTGIVVSINTQPKTVNTSCGGNKDNGIVTLTIFGSAKFDVRLIDTTSLRLNQGTPASSCSTGFSDTDNFLDLTCKFATCPLLGPALVQTNGQVVLDGNLFPLSAGQPGTAIHGTDTVKIN